MKELAQIFRAPLDGKSRGECVIHLLGVDIQNCQNFKWMFLGFLSDMPNSPTNRFLWSWSLGNGFSQAGGTNEAQAK